MTELEYPERERGAGDHDQPYRFGRKLTPDSPFPFTIHQFVKLFLLRARVRSSAIEAPTNVAIAEVPRD